MDEEILRLSTENGQLYLKLDAYRIELLFERALTERILDFMKTKYQDHVIKVKVDRRFGAQSDFYRFSVDEVHDDFLYDTPALAWNAAIRKIQANGIQVPNRVGTVDPTPPLT